MKFSMYSMLVERENDLVIYNSKNAQYVKFNKEPELSRAKHLIKTQNFSLDDDIVKALYERGYIVDDNVDEYAEAKSMVEKYYEKVAKKLELLLYVTEHCNFRCVYCPQKHQPKTLSPIKWDSLFLHIEKGLESAKYTEIELSYFGGEPLLESKEIIRFLEKIKNLREKFSDVKFVNHFTTNGYLLTPNLYDKLVDLGATYFQVTVDGFAETHDKLRPRADGAPTWDKIIENLKYINSKDDEVIIALRVNYNKDNINSMENFYAWYRETFTNSKIQLASHPISEFSVNVDTNLLATEEEIDYMENLDANNLSLHEQKYENLSLIKLGYTCRSAKKNHYSLSADAKLYRCNHAFDNCFGSVGYLDDVGNFVFDNDIEEWNSGYETTNCSQCFVYPLCAARRCPLKKVYQKDSRPDCGDFAKEKERIYKDIQNGIYCS